MALFKCKMCGGSLEINNNETVFDSIYYDKSGVHSIDILERKDGYFEIKNNVKYSDSLKKSLSPIAFLEYIDSIYVHNKTK